MMKTLLFILITISLTSCSKVEAKDEVINCMQGYDKETAIRISPINTPNSFPIEGIGVEMDPLFYTNCVARNDGSMKRDWNLIYRKRIVDSGIKRFRMMMLPNWWEPQNDDNDPNNFNWRAFTFQSTEMEMVYDELDVAQEVGGYVNLTLWGCPFNYWLRDLEAGDHWVTRANSDEELSECFCALLKYLLEERGYDCIKEVTIYNEPECRVTDIEHYVANLKAFDKKLREVGLRERIKLNLSDNTDIRRWFLEDSYAQLNDIADVYNSHCYLFSITSDNEEIYDWEAQNVAVCKDKPHFVGEFNCISGDGNDQVRYGTAVTRIALNFINAGAVGVSLWSLYDQFYSVSDLHRNGLWRYVKRYYEEEGVKEDYEKRPLYYAYTLMSKFLTRGSIIYPIKFEDKRAIATAVEDTAGKRTYIICNGSSQNKSFDLMPVNKNKSLNVYSYTEDNLPVDDSPIGSKSKLSLSEGVFRVFAPAYSVIYLSEK